MDNTWIVILMALLGALGRTIVPFLQALQTNPDTQFDRKFVIPAAVAAVLSIIGLPLILSGLPDSAWSAGGVKEFVLVFVAAWGLTDMARAGQKQLGG